MTTMQGTENKNAGRSMWLGLASILCNGFTGVPAIILGALVLRSGGATGDRVKAWIGIITGALFTLVWGGAWAVAKVDQLAEEKAAQVDVQKQRDAVTVGAPRRLETARKALEEKNMPALVAAVQWLRMNSQPVPAELADAFAGHELERAQALVAGSKFDEALAVAKGASGASAGADKQLADIIAKIEAMPAFDGAAVLGAGRTKVHAVLGTPTEEEKDFADRPYDKFMVKGTKVSVLFDTGKAVRLFVGKGIARNKVNLPEGSSFKLGGIEYAATDVTDSWLYSNATFEKNEERKAGAEQRRQEAAAAAEAKKQASAREKETKKAREAFAADIEHNMLMSGADARVRAVGTNSTVLRITWVLCNRATLTQMTDGTKWGVSGRDKLGALGFKKLECHDGYGEGAWTRIE